MTKAGLIDEIARVAGTTLREAKLILETILDSMVKALSKGEEIEIRRFGSFSTRRRAPRTGRNPSTGKRVDVPARRVPRFRPSRELLGLVNGARHVQQDFNLEHERLRS
jgi:integration host factor subunit beta